MPDLAVVQADLTVVQADLALGSLEALLDAPAEVGHADQLRQWHLGGRPAQVGSECTSGAVAADQQVAVVAGDDVDPGPVVVARPWGTDPGAAPLSDGGPGVSERMEVLPW